MDMLKRLLNVITIVFVITLATTIVWFVANIYSGRDRIWEGVEELISLDIAMFVGILVFNYIVFKKITLWHK